MSESPTQEQIRGGTSVYTPQWLARYDTEVLEELCGQVWRCDRAEMLAGYDRNIGPRHLDLGPGTGFFLDNCARTETVALVDLNPAVLAEASARLARFSPTSWERDVLSPFTVEGGPFDSAGLSFLMHCLPGGMAHKAQVLDHAREHVRAGGRIFGSTVLYDGVAHTDKARGLLEELNDRGTFSNRGDSLDGLEHEIAKRFSDHRVTVHGSVALFEMTA